MRRAVLLLGVLLAGPAAAGDPAEPAPTPVLDRYRSLGTVELPVREASGLVVLPAEDGRSGVLVVVSDEGGYDPAVGEVCGSLFRVPYRLPAEAGGSIETGEPTHLVIATGDLLGPRLESWSAGSLRPLDIESIAPVPGAAGFYLLGGERDATVEPTRPANRAYLVRIPPEGGDTAELVALFALPDGEWDGENDRYEAVAVLPGEPAAADEWRAWLLKERSTPPGRSPGATAARLRRGDGKFLLEPAAPVALADRVEVVATISDAALAPDGAVWLLDRWRRVGHVARPDGDALRRAEVIDLWEVLRKVPGDSLPTGPHAPGDPARTGYGLHEGIAFDREGRLFLTADRSESFPSALTVLEPLAPR